MEQLDIKKEIKKYELTEEVKISYGITLHRIRALISFSDVAEGQMGGWIESEKNLSQEDNAWVYGNAKVCGDAKVYGDAEVWGDAWVSGDAEVYKKTHIFTIGPIGSRSDTITIFRDKDNEVAVRCGCFSGKVEEFLIRVEQTHGDNKHGKVYRLAVEMAKEQIELEGEG